jgi:aminomethyltransferase
MFRDKTDATALIAVQGPKAIGMVEKLVPGISELKSFHFRDGTIDGVSCTIARTGYTGEDGVEIFCPWNDAPKVWDAFVSQGAKPIGLGARDTLRLEARLSLYGNDIDETTNPIEAGLGWVTKLDKAMFVGKEALQSVKEKPLPRKLVGFETTGRGIAHERLACADGRKEYRTWISALGIDGDRDEIPRRLPRQRHRSRRRQNAFLQALVSH